MYKKSTPQVIFILLALILINFTTILAQKSINKSPFLQLLDQQIEKNYVPQQMNMRIDELTVIIPMLYVQLLGSAMRNLKSNLNQHPTSLEKFENLNNEIISLIPQIANVYNSTNSSKTGYEYNDATTLEDYYYRALEGIYSENFKQHYKELKGKDITQVTIPFVLEQDEPTYIKEAKKEEGIALLGIKADEVKGLPSPKYNHRSFPENFIVGTWINKEGKSVTFQKRGNVYVGVIESQEEYNDGWNGYEQKVSIRRIIMSYEMYHSELRSGHPDPKNASWYSSFTRWYKGQRTTTYVPHIEYVGGPIQESTFFISWDAEKKRFNMSTDNGFYYRN